MCVNQNPMWLVYMHADTTNWKLRWGMVAMLCKFNPLKESIENFFCKHFDFYTLQQIANICGKGEVVH